jgi:hypothetical protein
VTGYTEVTLLLDRLLANFLFADKPGVRGREMDKSISAPLLRCIAFLTNQHFFSEATRRIVASVITSN